MDCAQRTKIIREAKTFAEIKEVISGVKLSPSAVELLRTSYQIRDKQPTVAAHFMETVIKEMEEDDKKEHPEREASNEVGGTEREPKDEIQHKTSHGQEPDTSFEGAENQMKEDIMPGLHPDIARMMQPQMNSMPPLNMPQQIKQMQYTVRTMLAPLEKKIKELASENATLRAGISALDKKVQETQNKPSVKLEVPSGRSLKETTMNLPTASSNSAHESTEDRRSRIAIIDKMMNDGRSDIYG